MANVSIETGRGEAENSLREEIESRTRENREGRSQDRERRLIQARHDEGIALLASAGDESGSHPEPDFEALGPDPLPPITPDRLTPGLLRAGILRDGAVLVRGLVERDAATQFAEQIERAFEARAVRQQALDEGQPPPEENDGYFEIFRPRPPYNIRSREFVTGAGGVWAADSPRLMFEMLELLEKAGLQELIGSYLGERPVISVEKCTLRKVAPETGNGHPGWHQDGRFLGEVRALNVWVSLTHCGDDAPGLFLLPKRIDDFLPTGTEGAVFDWVVSPNMVDEVRGDIEVVKPIFEPGDAMLFDDRFLHSTAADAAMPNHRYAIESWFFGPSGFPVKYTPLAL